MKSTIFARPNLKMIFLGAALVVVVQHLITTAFSQSSSPEHPIVVNAREPDDPEASRILSMAGRIPTSHVYARLSEYHERRGDYRRALRYLRLATMAAEKEDTSD